MLSSDAAPPVDRPNLSKDYLAGSAPEDWLPLRPDGFYAEAGIDLRLDSRGHLDRCQGAQCRRSPTATICPTTACCWRPAPSRCGCRSRAPTSRMSILCVRWRTAGAIIDAARGARRAIVIGASFIGLEAAAALRARGIEVHVVARSSGRWSECSGPTWAISSRALHEEHGVIFHLGDTVTAIDGKRATLKSGEHARGGLRRGRRRGSSAPGAGRAGRACARPRRRGRTRISRPARPESMPPATSRAGPIRIRGENIRVEHWVVAERQGQTAARNMLGSARLSMRCRFSGASTTTCRSTMSAMPKSGTKITVDGDICGQGLPIEIQEQRPRTCGGLDL